MIVPGTEEANIPSITCERRFKGQGHYQKDKTEEEFYIKMIKGGILYSDITSVTILGYDMLRRGAEKMILGIIRVFLQDVFAPEAHEPMAQKDD